jgi:hypothetical protein
MVEEDLPQSGGGLRNPTILTHQVRMDQNVHDAIPAKKKAKGARIGTTSPPARSWILKARQGFWLVEPEKKEGARK